MMRVWCGFRNHQSPSPGTPGEGRGEGSAIWNLKSQISDEDPHPNPLPEYRERGLRSSGAKWVMLALLLSLPFASAVAGSDGAAVTNAAARPHAKCSPVALSESRWTGGLMG